MNTFKLSQQEEANVLNTSETYKLDSEVDALSIEVQTDKEVWVNCMVYDAEGHLRAQLINIRTPQPLVIHSNREKSSPYTVAGSLPQGDWRIDFSVWSNQPIAAGEEWCTCTVSIGAKKDVPTDKQLWQDDSKAVFQLSQFERSKIVNQEARWYKGDFHTHTIYSDGEMTREENIESAKLSGLDFFVATEHNLVPTSWVDEKDVFVIPGVEVTSPLGHFNILNANTSPFEHGRLVDMFSEEGMNHLLEADYGNHIISINHPFLTEWKWLLEDTRLDKVDSMEIWNDPTYEFNPQATEWALIAWNYLLNDGYRITGIGGSDSHLKREDKYEGSDEPSIIGDPGTFIYCNGLSADHMTEAIKRGNVTVSRGERVQFSIGNQLPGAPSRYRKGIAEAFIDTEESLEIEWILDGEIVQVDSKNEASYAFDFSNDDTYHWLRIDVRHATGELYGFSNPIYFGSKTPTMKTWKDVLNIMKPYMED